MLIDRSDRRVQNALQLVLIGLTEGKSSVTMDWAGQRFPWTFCFKLSEQKVPWICGTCPELELMAPVVWGYCLAESGGNPVNRPGSRWRRKHSARFPSVPYRAPEMAGRGELRRVRWLCRDHNRSGVEAVTEILSSFESPSAADMAVTAKGGRGGVHPVVIPLMAKP